MYDPNQKKYTATNDVTGALLKSKPPSKEYEDGWERIFGSKKTEEKEASESVAGDDIRYEQPHAMCRCGERL
jgi:hypothetical protein